MRIASTAVTSLFECVCCLLAALYLYVCCLLAAPVIERYTGPFYANQSATATLTCRASGLPLPKLTWSRNGLKLKDQADTLVLTYTMKYVTKGDAGSYECLAENVAGNDKKTLQVVVYCKLLVVF